MTMVKELNKEYGIPKVLRFELDEHGMERAVIKTSAVQAIIYLQGAHITNFHPRGEKPLLFLSSKSNFATGKAIRGGIPLIFPWFGAKRDDPNAPMHGFARTSQWQVNLAQQIGDVVAMQFALDVPNHSSLRFFVLMGPQLDITLEVLNDSALPLTFEEAFHSYFAVSDVRNVFIEGLSRATFIDKTDQMSRKIDGDQMLHLEGETDRVYVNTESTCRIFDPLAKRCIKIAKTHSATTVLWNPWSEKARTMADMGKDEWQRMVCIETANAADSAITLQPGETHRMSASIGVEAFDPVAVSAKMPHPEAKRMRRAG